MVINLYCIVRKINVKLNILFGNYSRNDFLHILYCCLINVLNTYEVCFTSLSSHFSSLIINTSLKCSFLKNHFTGLYFLNVRSLHLFPRSLLLIYTVFSKTDFNKEKYCIHSHIVIRMACAHKTCINKEYRSTDV